MVAATDGWMDGRAPPRRRAVAQRGMQSGSVIVLLDEGLQIPAQMIETSIGIGMDLLPLESLRRVDSREDARGTSACSPVQVSRVTYTTSLSSSSSCCRYKTGPQLTKSAEGNTPDGAVS